MNSVFFKMSILASIITFCSACAAPPPDGDAQKRAEIDRQFAGYQKEFPDVPEIDAETLLKREKAGEHPVLVDVRTDKERAVSIIPGAISKDEFEAHEKDYRDKQIVTYCTIGYRSGLYAKKLEADGFDVENLKGSVLSWAHAGGEFVDPDGKPTKRVHVYGKTWDLLPSGYEAIW